MNKSASGCFFALHSSFILHPSSFILFSFPSLPEDFSQVFDHRNLRLGNNGRHAGGKRLRRAVAAEVGQIAAEDFMIFRPIFEQEVDPRPGFGVIFQGHLFVGPGSFPNAANSCSKVCWAAGF